MLKEFKTFSILLLAGSSLSPVFAQAEFTEVEEPADVELQTAEADPIRIDLEYIFERIREFSPQVLFERESMRRALEASYQQRAALLPSVTLFADQNRQQLGRGYGGASSSASPYSTFSAGIEGRQTLLDSQRYANYRLAQLEQAISEYQFEVAYQDILQQAVQLYFTVLRDMRRVEIYEGNIEREADLLKLAKHQFELGAALKIDVTRAEVRVATQRRQLMEAETLQEDSLMQLKALLDLELDVPVAVDRAIIEDIISPPEILKYASMESLSEARAELVSQQKQLEQAQLASKAAGWQRLPSLDIYGRWGWESETALDGEEEEAWLVGIEASMPLFEGGRIAAEKREAQAAVRQNDYQMRGLKLQIEREFKYAIIDMKSRYAQIDIARDEVRLGNDEVDQAMERYREGLADNRELIDAQQRLADAEQSHLQAVYLYGLSRLSFARAIGKVERVDE